MSIQEERTLLPLCATQSVSNGISFAPHLDLQDGQARSNMASPQGLFIVKENKVFEHSVDINPPNGPRRKVGERF